MCTLLHPQSLQNIALLVYGRGDVLLMVNNVAFLRL